MKLRTIGYILTVPMIILLGAVTIVSFNWIFLIVFALFLVGLVLTGKKEYE